MIVILLQNYVADNAILTFILTIILNINGGVINATIDGKQHTEMYNKVSGAQNALVI